MPGGLTGAAGELGAGGLGEAGKAGNVVQGGVAGDVRAQDLLLPLVVGTVGAGAGVAYAESTRSNRASFGAAGTALALGVNEAVGYLAGAPPNPVNTLGLGAAVLTVILVDRHQLGWWPFGPSDPLMARVLPPLPHFAGRHPLPG